MPAVHPVAVGAVIDGKYAIEAPIAEGGIGIIVRAHHVGLGQRVAIKYLKPQALSNRTFVERFEREARLAAMIASEHVVRVHDVGNAEPIGPYIVMEYLVGRNLGSILEEGGTLPVERAVDYVLQACDALAEAHALGIVHRDIKPENLFLVQRPSNTALLKIIDFGISKVAPKRGEEGRWARETGDGERVGTPLYMSPEQLRSASDVDPRSDIWALGVILYELVSGEYPFDATDMPVLCTSILSGQPKPLRAVLADAPPAIEAVIAKCLQKDREQRYRNVAELAQDLAPLGGAAAQARVARIKHVVRRAGNSIRPPTPMSFPVQPWSIGTITGVGAKSDPNRETVVVREREESSPHRRAAIAAIAGVVVCGIIALAAFTRGRSDDGSAQALSAPVALGSAPIPANDPAPEPVAEPSSASPVESASAPPLAPQPSQATPRAAAPPASTSSPRKASPPPTALAAASAPPPPPAPVSSEGSSRRALFGDRK